MRIALNIPPGLVADDTTFASEGAWSDASWVRFWRGRPQTVGGWQKAANDALTGVCRDIYGWTNTAGVANTAFGTNSKLEVLYGGGLYDITPVGLAAGAIDGTAGVGFGTGTYGSGTFGGSSAAEYWPRTWALSSYGQTLIANPRGNGIYQWSNNTAVVAALVTNAPTTVTYALVTDTRQIMAFGCNEETSGTFNPMCIRFSDIEAITDWTTTSTNNAGEVILSGGGRIVSAAKVGAYLFVWTDNDLYLGQYIGSTSQTWKFDRVGQHCGLIGPNAAVVINQVAYWLGGDFQFRTCALGAAPVIMVSPVQATMASNFATLQQDKVICALVSQFGEAWWFYPDSRDGSEISRYVTVSTLSGEWSRGSIVRTAFVDAGPAAYPLGVDYTGNIYYHELGQSADGATLSWFLQSADQYIQEGSPYLMLTGMWPDFQDQAGNVSMTITTRKYPQAVEYTRGPYTLEADRNQRSFRASGRVARVKLSGDTAPAFMRLGKLVFDAQPTGLQ